MTWTDERVELLKKLWSEGLSASQIANELGGVTRNAVIGKVHRLSLSGRAKPAGSSVPRPRRVRQAGPTRSSSMRMLTQGNVALKMRAEAVPEPRRIPLEEIVVPIALRASILTLTDTTCKWPIGEPGTEDFHFCGHNPRGGSPYCEYHSRVAYQTVDRRRERRAAG